MSVDWVKPWQRNGVHLYRKNSRKYYPNFKVGRDTLHKTYWQCVTLRCVSPFACLVGREVHMTREFFGDTIRNPNNNFSYPEGDEYYLVDSNYPNTNGYLASYKREIYHLTQFDHQPSQTAYERFNKTHSSLRSVIERSFGVWKARWRFMKDIPCNYDFVCQRQLVCATMAIHNFIRRTNLRDIAFNSYDKHTEYVLVDEEALLGKN
ncbi:hypothetical protein ACSBR2_023772 [Camellia fascicularis]